MSTNFPPSSLQDLGERIGYEDWLLESIYALGHDELFLSFPDDFTYAVDGSPPVARVWCSANIVMGDWRPKFLRAGAPLVFTATFKLLDMLLEWILEENGRKAGFRFSEKIKQLQESGLVLPPFISARPWLFDILEALYKETEPLRSTLIHSRHFETEDGALRVAPSKKGSPGARIELDGSDLRSFAQLLVSVLRCVQERWAPSDRLDNLLRWHADRLAKLHKLPAIGLQPPVHSLVRVYTRDERISTLDVDRIRSDLAIRNPGQAVTFDVRVVVVQDSTPVAAYLFPHEALSGLADLRDVSKFVCELPAD